MNSTRPVRAQSAAAAITLDREERKYFVAPDAVAGFARVVGKRLAPHRYTGPGANRLPHPQHFTTSVYFDTPSHAHMRAAIADPHQNAKLRSREYYDLHPALAELAVDPAQIVRYQPSMWFELKRKLGTRTQKARVQLHKRDVPAFLGGSHPAFQGAALDEDDPARVLADYCRELGEPLIASCLVNYRRIAFEDAAGALRVTLDLDLAFYAPPADLWSRSHALVRDTLGPACHQPRQAIVEVKCRGPAPEWLLSALGDAAAQSTGYSKFLAGAQAVHGAR